MRVIEAGVNLLADRIDLARVDLKESIARASWSVCATAAFAAAFLLALSAGVMALLAAGLPLAATLFFAALVCVGAGAALRLRGRRASIPRANGGGRR